jgi:hypothetical protein
MPPFGGGMFPPHMAPHMQVGVACVLSTTQTGTGSVQTDVGPAAALAVRGRLCVLH